MLVTLGTYRVKWTFLPALSIGQHYLLASIVDCEQSLFFFTFNEGSARARERRAAKPRDARNDDGARSYLRLVRFSRRTKKKERLLAVKPQMRWMVLISYCSRAINWLSFNIGEGIWNIRFLVLPVWTRPSNNVCFVFAFGSKDSPRFWSKLNNMRLWRELNILSP